MASKPMLSTVFLVLIAVSSAVPQAQGGHGTSSRIKLHASGNDDTGDVAAVSAGDCGFRAMGCFAFSKIQMGPVVRDHEAKPEVTFTLFNAEGVRRWNMTFGYDYFKPGEIAKVEFSQVNPKRPYALPDICRLIISSGDGWRSGSALYFRWVTLMAPSLKQQTFAVNRWVGPEMLNSLAEIDNCDYGAAAA